MNLEGARVLVTGASRGIGRAMVMALRAEGAHPIACARGAEALAPLAELGCETLVQDVAAADA
ncbi:MAG: SDR family NAD(P)-dependent oxidoreductase, partial [Sandaracinaceae bacterium]|nr:SDR family NAD(P)-dependent oxidoreductase [Sandaracinaceae bacterium]